MLKFLCMHNTIIPDRFLMINAIARISKRTRRKNNTHPIIANISVSDSIVAGAE